MPSDARRLLVISYYFPPDGCVGGLRWAGIAKYLARLGWQVSVLTASRPAGSDATPGVQVEWCPRFPTVLDRYQALRRRDRQASRSVATASRLARPSRPPGLLRELRRELVAFLALPDWSRGWLLRAALRARSVVRRFQPHFVVSSGPPHSAHLVAAMATMGGSARWFIDLRDPWAGPIATAWQSHPIWGTRMFRAVMPRLERLAFRAAQGVIATTPQLAEALTAKYPDVAVTYLRNGVDPESLPPRAPQSYGGIGIAYAGTLYGSHDLGSVMQALRVFLQRHPEAAQAGSKLRVAGHADPTNARACEEQIAALGLEQHVEVLGVLPRSQALDVLSRSRLAVVLAQELEMQVPAKLYELVAMGIPTLVVAEARSAAAIEGKRLGVTVLDSGDVDGILRLLEELWRNAPHAPPSHTAITYGHVAARVQELLTGPGPIRMTPATDNTTALTQEAALPYA